MTTAHLGRVRATAFAKLTLSLRVLGPRREDGFHELEALTVPIGQPHDTLEAVAVPYPPGVTFEVVAGDQSVPTGHQNLAMRAAESLLIRAGRAGHGVQLSLRKRIPTARGLGGGSADAAAAMLAVHRLLEVNVSEPELFELAADLGSDVPFFLGGGPSWMRGRGEELEPVVLPRSFPPRSAFPSSPPLPSPRPCASSGKRRRRDSAARLGGRTGSGISGLERALATLLTSLPARLLQQLLVLLLAHALAALLDE